MNRRIWTLPSLDIETTVEEQIEFVKKGFVSAFPVDVEGGQGIGIGAEVKSSLERMIRPDAVCEAINQALLERHREPASVILLLRSGALPVGPNASSRRDALRRGYHERSLDTLVVYEHGVASIGQRSAPDAQSARPVTETEALLESIWREVLDVTRVERNDSFFKLGGNSLRVVQMLARVDDLLGVRTSPRTLFDAPSLQAFAAEIERSTRTAPPVVSRLVRVPRHASLPVSPGEQRLWFSWRLDPESVADHVTGTARLMGALDLNALAQAFAALTERHESLRTTYAEREGTPYRVIGQPAPLAIGVTDLSAHAAEEQERRLQDIARELARQPFDLEHGPLLRARVCRLGPAEHALSVTLHHIVCDGWSITVLLEELAQLYRAACRGVAAKLAPLPIDYADFAVWQKAQLEGALIESQLAYWRAELAGGDAVLELPTDRPRPPVASHLGDELGFEIDSELTRGLTELARRQGVTLFVVLLGAFQVLLHRLTGRPEVRVGVPVANRSRIELEKLIGFFVNTQVLRADFAAEPTFVEHLVSLQDRVWEALGHQDLPFEKLVEALNPERNLSHNPLFQVLFNHQEALLRPLGVDTLNDAPAAADVRFERLERHQYATQFDLSLDTTEEAGALRASLTYSTDLFDRASIERVALYFKELCAALVRAPEERVARLPFVPALERQRLVQTWQGANVEHAPDQCLHQLVEAQVARTPDAVALEFGATSLSYRQLNARANRLARELRARGVGPDAIVGLCAERSVELVVGLLAIVKAGGAYLPLDPEYPDERLLHMLSDARPVLVLVHGAAGGKLASSPVPLVALDGVADASEATGSDAARSDAEANLPNATVPENLAYCIFTSGSTGRPKGAGNSHAALVNRLLWMQAEYRLSAADRVLQKTPFSFDVSVWEFFWPLACGARLVVARPGAHRDPVELCETIERHGVTTLHFVPSMLRAFLDGGDLAKTASVRQVMCSGEALAYELSQRFMSQHSARLHNLYGPTEAAIDVTFWQCQPVESRHGVPIGRPIDNTQIWILDAQMNPVPVGVSGELFIGGRGLARGYANRPELTAERFVPSPLSADAGARMYRTGDLARFRPDGAIEYVGRIDHQVKLRGFRIELGEIEAVLLECGGVRDAAVMVRAEGPGDGQLVAYVVADSGAVLEAAEERRALEEQLEGGLAERLPDYMRPSVFVFLPELPLSSNGKLDRKALPAVDLQQVRRAYVAPETEVEQRLAGVWREVLRLPEVGLRDNFFALGGDSIVALQVVSKARALGIRLAPKDLFQHQTLEQLSRVAERTHALGVDLGSSEGDVPLTPVQHWFFERELAGEHHFNQSLMLRPRTPLDAERLAPALTALVAEHAALRLRFARTPEGVRQWYAGAPSEPVLDVLDLSGSSDAVAALASAAERVQAGLDLERGPVLRALLVQLGPDEQRLLIVCHHLVVDGVSWRILLGDLERIYLELAATGSVRHPVQRSSSFKRWSEALGAYASSAELEAQRAYYAALTAQPEPSLPADEPNARGSFRSSRTCVQTLGPRETEALLGAAPQAYRAQASDLLVTALARTLCDWSGRDSVLVELEGHGREDLFAEVDVSHTVGWFTSLYPVRLGVDRSSCGNAIRSIKEQLRQVPVKGIGYGVLRHLRAEAAGSPRIQPQVRFNYLGQFAALFEQSQLWSPADEERGVERDLDATPDTWFDVDVLAVGGDLEVRFRYDSARHAEATVQALAAGFMARLREQIAHCQTPEAAGNTPSDFPLARLTQAELDALPVPPREIEDIFPLSPMQQGLLLHTLLEPGSGIYLMQDHYRIQSAIDPQAFVQGWERVIAEHPALRASFSWQFEGKLVQVIQQAPRSAVQWIDYSALAPAEQERRLEETLAEERQRGFDLSRAPLLCFRLFQFGPASFRFVQSYHHILIDAWCRSLLLVDFFREYSRVLGGLAPEPRARPLYRDFIGWLDQRDWAATRRFWQNELAGFEAATPLGIDRPAPQGADASSMADAVVYLDARETAALVESARDQQLTLNTLAQGAWALVLGQYGGADDVLFGVTVAGRPSELPDITETVGLFINTIPLRVRIPAPSTQVTAGEWLRGLLDDNLALRQHEHLRLIDIQAESEVPRGQPLFHSLFVFENAPLDAELMDRQVELTVEFGENRTHTNYPLTVVVVPGQRLLLQLTYDERFLQRADVERMLAQFRRVLSWLSADATRALSALPAVGEAELGQLAEWNATAAAYPLERGYVALFEAQVARHPERVAARCMGRELTYAALDARANQIGHALRGAGVQPGHVVALLAERDLDLLALILGVFKAGAAYVPLDGKHPGERTASIVTLSQSAAVIVTDACRPAWQAAQARLLESSPPVLMLSEVLDGESSAALGITRGTDELAYVIYTSGSTGTPKGAMVTSAGMLNNQLSKVPYLRLGERDVIAQTASQSFDISVWQFLLAPLCGARIEIIPDAIAHDPEALLRHAVQTGVTVLESVPSLIAGMLESDAIALPALRWLLPTGEAMPPELARAWFARYPEIPLVNAYGPAECADDVCLATITSAPEAEQSFLPIGRATDNNRIYVLNGALAPLPVGIVGELCVAGVGVGRGYLADPARTAEVFVPNPFGAPGERLYRTGDLARYRADGSLECVGRLDQQVKIRGYRIELGEIEARLAEHDLVREAVVLARADGGANKRLVAYLVPRAELAHSEEQRLYRERIKADLEAFLPEYMVPQLYVLLPELPLSANGKVDRKRLPAPDLSQVQRGYVGSRNLVEQRLSEIWRQVLHVDRVGVHDNFFELGGDSIVAIQVVGKAKNVGLALTPKDVFEHQTLEALARVARPAESVSTDRGEVEGDVPLGPIQRWFFEAEPADPHHDNQSVLLEPSEVVDVERLEQAIQSLVAQHPALRLRYRQQAEGWRQWYAAAPAEGVVPERLTWHVDLGAEDLGAEPLDAAIERHCNVAQRSLNLEQGPLLRALHLDLGAGRGSRLLVVIHHLAVDGVSWRILLEDLEGAYRALGAGQAVELGERTTSFKRWTELLATDAERRLAAGELEYWQATVRGATDSGFAPEIAGYDRGVPATIATTRTLSLSLDAEETQALLTQVPEAYRTQIGDVLLTALAHTLCARSGDASVLIELEGHGREDLFERVDVSRTVGWFTSLYPVRLRPELEHLGRSLQAIKEQLRALPDRGIGYGMLRYATAAGRVLDGARPALSFNYLGQFERTPGGWLSLAREPRGDQRSLAARQDNSFDVVASVYEGRLEVSWTFNSVRHERALVEGLLGDYVRNLRELVAHALDVRNGGLTPSDVPLAALTQAELDVLPVPARNIEDVFPLSPMQQGLLLHTLLDPTSGMYLMQERYTLDYAIEPERFLTAWERVIERHPALRASFFWRIEDKMVQIIQRSVPSPIEYLDWTGLEPQEQEQRLVELLAEERARGFDLGLAPLLRFRLIRLADSHFQFVQSYHHILLDDWCRSLMLLDFFAWYRALSEGSVPALATPPLYRDFIAWLGRQDGEQIRAYWKETLAGFEAATPLAIDLPLGEDAGPSRCADAVLYLSEQQTLALGKAAQRHQLTVNTFTQGAWAVLMSQYSGHEDLLFGVTVAGRPSDIPNIHDTVGLFINSIPLRVRLPRRQDRTSIATWLERLFNQNIAMRQREHLPLVDIQALSEIPHGQALFHSLFVFENAPLDVSLLARKDEIRATLDGSRTHTNYPITVVIVPGRELLLQITYDERLFHARDIERMLAHYRRVLVEMIENPARSVYELPTLGTDELAAWRSWNATERAYPFERGYVGLFEQQVAEHPDRVAACCRGQRITYGELDARANRIGRGLVRAGVVEGDVVGVLAERSLEFLALILGVFKAGAAYVPLDEKHPPERTAQILDLAEVRVVAASEDCRQAFTAAAECCALAGRNRAVRPEALYLEEALRGPGSADRLGIHVPEAALAYVIYTSGSTGTPKGAMVTSAGMLNNQLSKVPYLELGEHDVIAQTASQSFDISVWQFLAALLCGARVEIVPDDIAHDPVRLLEHVAATGITVLESVPSMIAGMLAEDPIEPGGLRWLLPTGEAMSPELARRWFARYPGIRLVNAYGPAECADDVALCRVDAAPPREMVFFPIGQPTDNNRCHVLDASLRPLPPGVVGELCVSGVGVGRGYLRDPAGTALAFVPNPFAEAPGERLYRTGDLARYRADGVLEYVGRRDAQVKIRGYRIELGEIEARLGQHPKVRRASVLVQQSESGDKRLVAYVAADAPGDAAVALPEELRQYLLSVLPEYMAPRAYVLLDELPLTANGKVDRKALLAHGAGGGAAEYTAPRTELERTLASIWQDVLRVERVGIDANFFDLGGHSLLATQVSSRIARRLGVELPLRELFEANTVRSLAERVQRALVYGVTTRAPALVPVADDRPLPLSYAQQRLWFLWQLEPSSPAYNMPHAVRLCGPLHRERLALAFSDLLVRHATLRTTFRQEDDAAYQIISDEARVELPLEDLSGHGAEARDERLQAAMLEESLLPFELERGPVLRARLLRLGASEHVLLVTMHHIVSDDWSVNIFVNDLIELYAARVSERAATLSPLPVRYADFAVWQRQWMESGELARQLAYWQRALGPEDPVLALPSDRPRPARMSYEGARFDFSLDLAATGAVKALGQQHQVTPFVLVLAAFQAFLARTSGQSDIRIGVPVANRNRMEVERLIGFFVNTLVLRGVVDADASFEGLLVQAKESVLGAQSNQDLPFDQLVEARSPKRSLSHSPLFQAMYTDHPPAERAALEALGELSVQWLIRDSSATQFDLMLDSEEVDGCLAFWFTYSTDLFDAASIASMARHFQDLLEAGVARPEVRLAELELGADIERDWARKRQNIEERGRALLAVVGTGRTAFVAPRSDAERRLGALWQDLLGVPRVGADDDFFDLGGHSLLATQLVSRLRKQLAIELPLSSIFESSRLSDMALALERRLASGGAADELTLVRVDRTEPLPLSYAQRRLWFLWQLEPESTAYNIPIGLELVGALNQAALELALERVVRRHEAFRTTFREIDGQAYQVIGQALPVTVLHEDCSEGTAEARDERVRALAEVEAAHRFDLGRGPLLRLRLLRLAADKHVLLANMHHIVSDGLSMDVLLDELFSGYASACTGPIEALPEPEIQYVDYAAWQERWLASDVVERQLDYWKAELGTEFPVLELPTDRVRPPLQSHRGARLDFDVPNELAGRLNALAQERGVTTFVLLLAAFEVLLCRHSGQTDLRVGVPIGNRPRLEFERVIGFFVNTQVLRTNLADNPKFSELLGRVRRASLGAQANADVPFERLVEVLNPARSMSHSPLFQVMYNHQRTRYQAREALTGLGIRELEWQTATTHFDLTLDTWEIDGALHGSFTYGTDLFDAATIERLSAHFAALLRAVVETPEQRIFGLPMLAEAEVRATTERFAPAREDYPGEGLAEWIERQVALTPRATALSHEGESLSYAALNTRANQLARRLRELGVGPDALVGLCVERGVAMVVGALAILKAGGAYVPLDPHYPAERIRYMLADARPLVTLSESSLLELLGDSGGRVWCFDRDAGELVGYAENNLARQTHPEHLAYCIYTSGSTGGPKGVAISHGALSNFLAAMQRQIGIASDDRVLALTSLSFDIAGLELYWPLTVGAEVVLVDRSVASNPVELLERIRARRVSVVQATPATWLMLSRERGFEALRACRILCGGEALTPELARTLLDGSQELWNVYGPTETTIWSSACRLTPERPQPLLGAPISNTSLYVLDPHLGVVPAGVAGELYIGGDGLARGYLRRPALTAERFVPDPFGSPGARLYRTGDRVRARADGSLEYLGRIDQQLKIRGHRIEPAEIELRLREHPRVREAVVAGVPAATGEKRLVAYLVLEGGGADEASLLDELRSSLDRGLPEYMRPQHYLLLDSLPLTPNGKVDRQRLPAFELGAGAQRPYVAPRTPTEERLVGIWQEVLGVPRVGVLDNFFELGGHSLLATQLVSRIREQLATDLPLRSLFEAVTVEELAEILERQSGSQALSDAALDEMALFLDRLETAR